MRIRLILLCLLLALASCGGQDKPLAELFPGRVESLTLAKVIEGAEAMRAVDELHGKPIEVEDAAVAAYTVRTDDGVRSEAVVWVARMANAAQAREQAAVMLEKMLHPLDKDSPFHDPDQFRQGGADVYRFLGMGQVHLVFQKGDLIFWIAAPRAKQAEADQKGPALFLLDALLGE